MHLQYPYVSERRSGVKDTAKYTHVLLESFMRLCGSDRIHTRTQIPVATLSKHPSYRRL